MRSEMTAFMNYMIGIKPAEAAGQERRFFDMKKDQALGYMLVIFAGIMWGTAGLFSTVLSSLGLSASMVALIRLSSGAVFLGIFMLIKYGPEIFKIDAKGLIWCALMGIFVQGLYNVSYSEAVKETGMAAATIMLYTSPVFVSVMSRMLFKEKFTALKVGALVLNIAGCALAVTGRDFGDIHIPLIGFASGLAAGFLYSLLPVINTEALKEYNIMTITFYGLIIGSLLLTVISRPWEYAGQLMNIEAGLAAAGYGLIPTAAAYIAYSVGLEKRLETSKVPIMASIEVVSAAVIGVIALSQELSSGKLVGIAVLLMSIVLMNIDTGKLPAVRLRVRSFARRRA